MKFIVDVPVMNAHGTTGRPGKVITLALDTVAEDIRITTPMMWRDPVVGLAGLEAAVAELRLAADAHKTA